jgi:hypothetical protein
VKELLLLLLLMNEKGLEREMELNGGEENLNLNRVEVSAIDENEKSENGVNHTK